MILCIQQRDAAWDAEARHGSPPLHEDLGSIGRDLVARGRPDQRAGIAGWIITICTRCFLMVHGGDECR